MDKEDRNVLIFFSIPIILLFVFFGYGLATMHDVYSTTYYDVYRMRCPFGEFVIEGEGGGSFLSFRWETEMREEYVVKYFDNNELKTIILDAEQTSVIIDGTLQLEKIIEERHTFFGITYTGIIYKVHIPFLPEGEDITTDWD